MQKFKDMIKTIDINEEPIIGKSILELETLLISLDEKPFRGRQIFDWIYKKNIYDFSKMSDLPKNLREKLGSFKIHALEVINCDFCATAKMGFIKNLTTGEIVDQFLQLQEISRSRITNVVFMGMGEPFLNYKNTISAADLLHNPKGLNMAAWRITISTAGIINKIEKYTEEKQPYKLAISLNGSSQSQRLKTMPITQNQNFSDLLKVAKNYAYNSRKKVTFEYVLLDGINDEPSDALKLVRILNSTNCKLNLIPYNDIDGVYKRPNNDKIQNFLNNLNKAEFPVTIRWSNGQDIDAGCGQLATKIK